MDNVQLLQAISDLMDKKLEPIYERLDAIENRLDAVEKRLVVVEERLDVIESRLDAVESRLDAVEKRLVVVEERLDVTESRLKAIEERLGAMEIRLEVIEGCFGRLEIAVTVLRNGQTGFRKELKEVSIKVSETYQFALEAWGKSTENRNWLENSKLRL